MIFTNVNRLQQTYLSIFLAPLVHVPLSLQCWSRQQTSTVHTAFHGVLEALPLRQPPMTQDNKTRCYSILFPHGASHVEPWKISTMLTFLAPEPHIVPVSYTEIAVLAVLLL